MVFAGIKPKYSAPKERRFLENIMNTQLPLLGYSVPQQRQVMKNLIKNLDFKSSTKIWSYWDSFWQNGVSFDEKNLALLFWSEPKHLPLALSAHKKLISYAHDIECWAHSDSLSSLYAKFLEILGDPIDDQLSKWTTSNNPWLRRQSIVSLLYYARLRKSAPSPKRILSAVKLLLNDHEHYVQKGVGWTLRESYQIYPEETLKFISKNILDLSPTAFSAATEKLSSSQKKPLIKIRSPQKNK